MLLEITDEERGEELGIGLGRRKRMQKPKLPLGSSKGLYVCLEGGHFSNHSQQGGWEEIVYKVKGLQKRRKASLISDRASVFNSHCHAAGF